MKHITPALLFLPIAIFATDAATPPSGNHPAVRADGADITNMDFGGSGVDAALHATGNGPQEAPLEPPALVTPPVAPPVAPPLVAPPTVQSMDPSGNPIGLEHRPPTGPQSNVDARTLMAPLPVTVQREHGPSSSTVSLEFRDATLREVAGMLSTCFRRPVILKANADVRITRNFVGLTPKQLMEDLARAYPISFIEDDSVIVLNDAAPANWGTVQSAGFAASPVDQTVDFAPIPVSTVGSTPPEPALSPSEQRAHDAKLADLEHKRVSLLKQREKLDAESVR